jgi:AcrR family transcriptional regulator
MAEPKTIASTHAAPHPREQVREARSALYRRLIFEAAERNFAERGVEDTKMEAIAADAGLSLGTLYSVFPGKARLVAAIHQTRLDQILRRTEAADESGDPVEMLLSGVKRYVEFFVAHPNYLRMHLREGFAWGLGGRPDSSRQQADAYDEGIARQARLIERGIACNVFHAGEPVLMARMMVAMQQVQLADWVDRGMKREPADLIEEMRDQVRRSFCSQSPGARGARSQP